MLQILKIDVHFLKIPFFKLTYLKYLSQSLARLTLLFGVFWSNEGELPISGKNNENLSADLKMKKIINFTNYCKEK